MLVAAGLALLSLSLGLAYRRAHQEALCWRAFVDDGERPPEGDCERLR